MRPLTWPSPKSLGANPTPIAFAEVYLALQNGTVDAQENPLPTIEAKKFYEVQKNISLTGHIVDSLLTIVSGQLWTKLSDADKKIFTDGDARSRRQDRPRHHRVGDSAGRRVQEEGHERDHGRQERLPRGGAEDRHADGPRLSPDRLRPRSSRVR